MQFFCLCVCAAVQQGSHIAARLRHLHLPGHLLVLGPHHLQVSNSYIVCREFLFQEYVKWACVACGVLGTVFIVMLSHNIYAWIICSLNSAFFFTLPSVCSGVRLLCTALCRCCIDRNASGAGRLWWRHMSFAGAIPHSRWYVSFFFLFFFYFSSVIFFNYKTSSIEFICIYV